MNEVLGMPVADSADNRISLQKLEVFCKVVELGGVRRAAEALYVSQPVVSGHLHSLQDRIGAALFYRTGRNLALTEAGQVVHRWASDVLRGRLEVAQSLQTLSSGVSGTARLWASMSAGNSLLTPVMIRFRQAHPDVSMSLQLASVEIALEATRSGRADMCVVGTGAVLDSKAFDAELLGRPRFALIARADTPDIPDTVDARLLAQLPFVAPPQGLAIARSQEGALGELGVVRRRVVMELGSAEAIKQAVLAGLGVALLWHVSVQDELRAGTLREIKIQGPPIADRVYLVWRAGKVLSPMQQRLAERIREDISSALRAP